MADTEALHHALLRPAIIQILRAAGFHSTKPTVLDTLTDLAARYMLLISQKTASCAYDRTAIPNNFPPTQSTPMSPPLKSITRSSEETPNDTSADVSNDQPSTPLITRSAAAAAAAAAAETTVKIEESTDTSQSPTAEDVPRPSGLPTPTLNDALQALISASLFTNTLTATEEAWRETLRRPLSSYPAGAAREKERRRRDAEDTRDVREFVDWCQGPACAEMRRIAGLDSSHKTGTGTGPGEAAAAAAASTVASGAVATANLPGLGATGPTSGANAGDVAVREDYIAALKKKYSRAGDGSRYAGTVLGRHAREEGAEVPQDGVRIEGGPENFARWREEMAKKRKMENMDAAEKMEGVVMQTRSGKSLQVG